MTIKEARKLIAVFMVTYPNYKPIDVELAAATWANIMQDYEYEQVNMALNIYMRENTSGFAPTPGQLVDKIHSVTQPQELNEMEAWALVSRAIRNSGYNAENEYVKLPPIVQNAVGMPSQLRQWALDDDYNEEVVMSQFMRTYRTEVARQAEFQKLPHEAQMLIQNAAVNAYKAQIKEERDLAIKSSLDDKNALKIESKSAGVPMPDWVKEKIEKMRCGNE